MFYATAQSQLIGTTGENSSETKLKQTLWPFPIPDDFIKFYIYIYILIISVSFNLIPHSCQVIKVKLNLEFMICL